jgi:hypothetical protein
LDDGHPAPAYNTEPEIDLVVTTLRELLRS